jgi:hypothetical protein
MSDQEDSQAAIAPAFGEEMPGAAHLSGHRDPPGLESQRLELGFKNTPHGAHTLEIHRPAIDVGNVLKQLNRLFLTLLDIVPELFFGAVQER